MGTLTHHLASSLVLQAAETLPQLINALMNTCPAAGSSPTERTSQSEALHYCHGVARVAGMEWSPEATARPPMQDTRQNPWQNPQNPWQSQWSTLWNQGWTQDQVWDQDAWSRDWTPRRMPSRAGWSSTRRRSSATSTRRVISQRVGPKTGGNPKRIKQRGQTTSHINIKANTHSKKAAPRPLRLGGSPKIQSNPRPRTPRENRSLACMESRARNHTRDMQPYTIR